MFIDSRLIVMLLQGYLGISEKAAQDIGFHPAQLIPDIRQQS